MDEATACNGMKRRNMYFNKMIAIKGKNSIYVIKSVALHLLRLIEKRPDC